MGGAIIIGGAAEPEPALGLKCVAVSACCRGGISRRRGELGCATFAAFAFGGGPFHWLDFFELFLDPSPKRTLTTRIKMSVNTIGGPKIVALTPNFIKSLFDASAEPATESIFTAIEVNVSSHCSMKESSL